MSRRQLLCSLASVVIGLIGAMLLKRKIRELDSYITLGPVDNFKPGTVTTVEKAYIHLARREEGGFLALPQACTHLRGPVPWNNEKKQFICPCHGSTYNINGDL